MECFVKFSPQDQKVFKVIDKRHTSFCLESSSFAVWGLFTELKLACFAFGFEYNQRKKISIPTNATDAEKVG